MPKPMAIYEDSKAAILFSYHPGDHRRSKHIDTRKYFIRETVINGEIKLEYIHTMDQLADMKCLRELLSSYQMPDH
jgi:hypothetical protein